MREARINGRLVPAGKDAPDEAICPSCGSVVKKRHRRCQDRTVTWFWRHALGNGSDDCPLRYRPTA